MVSIDYTEIGGANYIADIIVYGQRNEKYIFDELNKDAKPSDEIRRRCSYSRIL